MTDEPDQDAQPKASGSQFMLWLGAFLCMFGGYKALTAVDASRPGTRTVLIICFVGGPLFLLGGEVLRRRARK